MNEVRKLLTVHQKILFHYIIIIFFLFVKIFIQVIYMDGGPR